MARRQQHVQDGTRQRPVGGRHEQLPHGDARTREREHEPPDAQRFGPDGRRRQVADHRGYQQAAGNHEHAATGQRRVAGERAHDERDAAEGEQPQPERDRVAEDDSRQLLRRHAPAGVEAVADGRPGQHRDTDVVGDRVGEEGGHGNPAARKRLADVAECDQVVPGQDEVVQRGQQDRERQPWRRRAENIAGDLVPANRPQLGPQHREGDQEQNEADQCGQRLAESLVHGATYRPPLATHDMASSSRRSNSARLSEKRWFEAFTIQSCFGSRAAAITRLISSSGTNSSCVE